MMLLASFASQVKEDIVMNRWLPSSAFLFRVMCLYQPEGSSERVLLLSPLICRAGAV